MSGPKVVRIVTREEIIELCEGQLARVDAALAEWTRVGRRNDCIQDEEIAAATGRREHLAALIASDRFLDLQKQAPIEEAFLRNDLQARLTKVAAAQAVARSRSRREQEAAASLLRVLRKSDRPLDPELEKRLNRGEAAAISEGFRLLSVEAATPTASTEFAAKFKQDIVTSTFAEWFARQPATPADPAIERIEGRLDSLAQLLSDEAVDQWRSRLAELVDASPARRDLLLDALELETGRALTEARRRGALLLELELMGAELKAAGIEIEGWSDTTPDPDIVFLEARLSKGRAAIDANRTTKAAAARRAAVLEGLAGLGYEVVEGMSTSLADQGRLVLRSATRPDYGVEVNAAAGGERMQMRAIAFDTGGAGPDPARDRDAETIWCGDVSALQESLTAVGGGLTIEKALPIGATPLKRVALEETGAEAAESRPALKEKTLR